MAKAVFIICVLAVLACAVSAERSLLRSLQQDFKCEDVKQAAQVNGMCDTLCNCIQTQKPNLFEKNTDSVKSLCRSSCNKCVDACKGAGFKGTQEACKGGNSLSQGGLSSCIGEYQGAKDDKAREAVRSKYSKAPK